MWFCKINLLKNHADYYTIVDSFFSYTLEEIFMADKIKRLAVLTSGGDAPGMNAVVRAVTRAAIDRGFEVIGIQRGYSGLIDGDFVRLTAHDVCDVVSRGGTMLYSARSTRFRTEEGREKAAQVCRDLDVCGIVTIGGDGTFAGASLLSKMGIPCVGIPATIDNDISCSDYTVGFDTALNTAVECVDKIRDTSQSHDRCSIVEVMGNKSGYLAVDVALAIGATAVLVPEVPFDFDIDVIGRIRKTMATGKQHYIVVVSEGVANIPSFKERIESKLGVVTKHTILGHIQRGGAPSARDRIFASQLGVYAVDLLEKGVGDRVVVERSGEIVDIDIQEALKIKKRIDMRKYRQVYELSYTGLKRCPLSIDME